MCHRRGFEWREQAMLITGILPGPNEFGSFPGPIEELFAFSDPVQQGEWLALLELQRKLEAWHDDDAIAAFTAENRDKKDNGSS
jgi:hypothetical protein